MEKVGGVSGVVRGVQWRSNAEVRLGGAWVSG